MDERLNLLLSTDIGTDIDDAVALYLALNSERIDLRGVYVTNGPVEDRAKITARMLRLARHGALVAAGESEPIYSKYGIFTTGMEAFSVPGNERRKTLQELGVETDWLSAMTRQLLELPGAVVASIAPLTNIARLLEKKPHAAANIRKLFIMGGQLGEGEYNFSHDSAAAYKVLASDLDIVVVPANVCSGYRLDADVLAGLSGSRPQKYLGLMASLWKGYQISNAMGVEMNESQQFGTLPIRMTMQETLRGIWRERRAGIFEGCDTFYSGLRVLSDRSYIAEDPFRYLYFYKIFKSSGFLHKDNWMVQAICRYLEGVEKKDFSVADAFVIYAMEHPERIRSEKAVLSCDDAGIMDFKPGKRHELVVDVDYAHFREYLLKRLRQKPNSLSGKGITAMGRGTIREGRGA